MRGLKLLNLNEVATDSLILNFHRTLRCYLGSSKLSLKLADSILLGC